MEFGRKKTSNVYDYLEWRGDLSFKEAPFCPVDNLIFSILVYLDYSDYVNNELNQSVKLCDIMKKYPKLREDKWRLAIIIPEKIRKFAKSVSRCRRFADVKLMAYENEIDKSMNMQFAAVTFKLDDGSIFVTYRGTDDSIIGWKEDFYLSIEPVAAQLYATTYLNRIAYSYDGMVRIGGHSKGGNLAVWAAAHTEKSIQDKLIKIYSNDSPGFSKEILESDGYKNISDRIEAFVAPDSIFGMLFDNDGRFKVISSSQSKLMQHDPFSWEIRAGDFVYLEERTEYGRRTDANVKKWLNSLSYDDRLEFTELLFSLLESTNANTITELRESKLQSIESIIKAVKALDKPSRDFLFQTIKKIFDQD